MLAFIEMLMAPAEKAGMKIPTDPRNFDRNQFPHFTVYAAMQLGQSMPTPTSHWHNATVIASIPDDKIILVTPAEVVDLGFELGYPLP